MGRETSEVRREVIVRRVVVTSPLLPRLEGGIFVGAEVESKQLGAIYLAPKFDFQAWGFVFARLLAFGFFFQPHPISVTLLMRE